MKLYKFLGILFPLTFSFPQSAFAVIVEGTFSGVAGQLFGENMHIAPDANFFDAKDFQFENEYQPFTGTFWYDTDLSGPGFSPSSPDRKVIYKSEADWLHMEVVGANGASMDILSRGSFPTFSEKPTDTVYLIKEGEGYASFQQYMTMVYTDFGPGLTEREFGPHRYGVFNVGSSTTPFPVSLIQDFEFSPEENPNNMWGGVRLETKGVLSGITYVGEFTGKVNKFEIHVRDSVSVPEPSSLPLLLLPLTFLVWRRFTSSLYISRLAKI